MAVSFASATGSSRWLPGFSTRASRDTWGGRAGEPAARSCVRSPPSSARCHLAAPPLGLLDGFPVRRHVADRDHVGRDLPQLPADRVQLLQLVLNLVLNALEAMQPISGHPRQLAVRTSRAQGSATMIQVADNGIGLDDADAAFEPFATTKPYGM